MEQKIVGVIPLYDEERESYWMVPGYMRMTEEAGAIPLMLPLTANKRELEYFLEICGYFIFTGGHDVSPELYGETRRESCGVCCEIRDEMESYLLKRAVELDRSVLGICRGIQLMNACFGGTLYQDIPEELGSDICHHMTPPYDREAHAVRIVKESPLYRILGRESISVNSYHHQGIRKLADPLRAAAFAPDGLVEAVYLPGKTFVTGVQWHPEFSYKSDENSRKLIREFLR